MNTKLAHAAGIFDVRGCICMRNNQFNDYQTLEVRLACTEKSWSVIDYLHKEFGGLVTNYSSTKNRPRKCWVLTGKKAQDFLASIESYFVNEVRIKKASFVRRRFRVGTCGKRVSNGERLRRLKMQDDWATLCRS